MKATRLNFYVTSFALMFVLGMALTPMIANAQDEEKTEAKDNSSSFNDSVQFDDMEPIFYDSSEDAKKEEVVSEDGGSGMMLYVGIAVVLVIVLVVLKKAGKKKA